MSSDPYVYPGTTVLKNIPGIRNQEILDRFECAWTRTRFYRKHDRKYSLPWIFGGGHTRAFDSAFVNRFGCISCRDLGRWPHSGPATSWLTTSLAQLRFRT